ncbi:DNA-directed RNA polymerase III subunit RPC6-like protein [Dinothrombium tinctorium]|uniref:DNA-directed RNA polymerase III subunit RPC6 n=1 Tax=Dinothrombium tinctorium TaxID=1965070 RepID=A0A3S3S5H7_9ACAR|nr:DNA-directed RNA polymerase III subunit RPC6-like protein [Dinothrombium tinctorium]RWS04503.1 DNA-directed RNA polymerase III subunit RPC6-like protein [Dinothrombium tinctorium]RWS10667.1 DNA-directed RNA polymerase III subunit RPC6-like protein [Dinothrombium tinctorium]
MDDSGEQHSETNESGNLSETEVMKRILELCKENERGVTEKMLQGSMPSADPMLRANAINKLLKQTKLEIMKQGTQLLYRLKDQKQSNKGTDDEERIVYAIIEEAGNKGIWSRDIRMKSNLSLTLLNKVLKTMEGKKLIKSVKSVAASKKKLYMLYDIEPDVSITGGSWYSNQDFESEFVEILNQQCFRFLQEKLDAAKISADPISRINNSYVTSNDVWKFIKDLGISKIELSITDIESILETLVYDGRVEKHVVVRGARSCEDSSSSSSTVKMYRAIKPLVKSTGLMRMPCGLCPVMKDCREGGVISPSKCIYFKEWFES